MDVQRQLAEPREYLIVTWDDATSHGMRRSVIGRARRARVAALLCTHVLVPAWCSEVAIATLIAIAAACLRPSPAFFLFTA